MQLPLQISARDISLTPAIETAIRTRAGKLDQFFDRIMGCRVLVESPHRHHHKGCLYNVRILLTVPGDELVVRREPHEDLYVAIRDAFNAAQRQLKEYSRRRRGDTKHHEEVPAATITELNEEEGFGFMTTADGREIYFHHNSVLNRPFRELKLGERMRYAEERGERGPQASSLSAM